jgi:hypothetical protein
MTRSRRTLHWPVVLLVAACLSLGACNRVGLAYDNLDLLIPWTLNDYLDLDRSQKSWLEPRLQQHLSWHCSEELPLYANWLGGSQALLQQPDSGQLNQQIEQAEQALQRISREITPSTVALLQKLDDQQVAKLFDRLDESNRELHEEYLQPALPEQISQRSEKMSERVEFWLGPLNSQQKSRIQRWSEELGEQNRIWLENRQAVQQAWRNALLQRHNPDFSLQVNSLLQEPERFHTEVYRQHFPRARQALTELFGDLLTGAEPQQVQRAQEQLTGLQQQLSAVSCRKAPQMAARS